MTTPRAQAAARLQVVPGTKPTADLEPLLRIGDIATYLRCSRRHLERLRCRGVFPKADLVLGNSPRWRRGAIDAWIEKGGRP